MPPFQPPTHIARRLSSHVDVVACLDVPYAAIKRSTDISINHLFEIYTPWLRLIVMDRSASLGAIQAVE
jgi:hypothetical protein